MRSKLNILVLGLLTLTSLSCTGNYLEINSNPYQPKDLLPDGYTLSSAMNSIAGCVISTDENTAQFTDCLLGCPLGGYFADSKSAWNNTISNFNPTDDWSRVFLKSDRIIPILYTNLKAVKAVSEKTNNPVPYAIAQIIKVAAMSRVTDAYGAIPYSRIGEDGSITTPYDSQEKVYDTFFMELDNSIKTLQDNPGVGIVSTADYVYGGDAAKWLKFANSLKLRLAMRIVYANEDKAREKAEQAIDPQFGGVIESNMDNAKWNYFNSTPNPFYIATRYNTVQADKHENGKVCKTGGDTHAAADIICYMNGYEDPRRDKYFIESEWTKLDNGVEKRLQYVGLRRGIIIPDVTETGHKYSGVNVLQTSPIYWMNAAEVAFLRAEGKAVFGFNMGGEAKTFYEQGIRLSFEQWGVENPDEYIADDEKVPTTYMDPDRERTNSYDQALSTITVAWDESADEETKQERIIIQKWIANWMLGNEAWADYRRTGYPHLIPATEDGNKSNGIVNSEKGARRMPYPADEYISNKKNIEEAIRLYMNGQPDNMASKVWWDCKPEF